MFLDIETVITFELRAYAKQNYLKWNCFFDIETVFTLNWIV